MLVLKRLLAVLIRVCFACLHTKEAIVLSEISTALKHWAAVADGQRGDGADSTNKRNFNYSDCHFGESFLGPEPCLWQDKHNSPNDKGYDKEYCQGH